MPTKRSFIGMPKKPIIYRKDGWFIKPGVQWSHNRAALAYVNKLNELERKPLRHEV